MTPSPRARRSAAANDTPGRHLVRLFAALVVAGALWAGTTVPAQAHATLVSTDPGDGSVLDEAPRNVTITFTEPVAAGSGSVRVFDKRGDRVDDGAVESGGSGEIVQVGLPDDLARGTYLVTYRVVSDDGHPVQGAIVMSVGEPTELDVSIIGDLLGSERDAPWELGAAIVRWIVYVAGMIAAGIALYLVAIGDTTRLALRRLARVAAVVGALAAVVSVPLLAVRTTSLGAAALVSPAALGEAAGSTLGTSAALRVAAMLLAWIAVARPETGWAAWPAAAGVVAAEVVTGHTRTTEPAIVTLGAGVFHVAAALIWVGGLVALAVTVHTGRRSSPPLDIASEVGRFSRLATWSVVSLAVAGAALAWSQVRAPEAITSTSYGWTLVAKVIVAGAVMGIGAYNQRVLVPSITRGDSGATWDRLTRTLRLEVVGVVAVLAVTAALVNLPPAARAAGLLGPFSEYVEVGGGGQLNVVVDPNQAGVNTIHLYVLGPDGRPAAEPGDIFITLAHPDRDIGPITRQPLVAGPGHHIHTGPELSISGDWLVTVHVRVSEFEELEAELTVPVNR